MAEKIAEQLDLNRFGIEGIYLTGSTNTSTAGPGSDIDLIIHFTGTPQLKEGLILWLES